MRWIQTWKLSVYLVSFRFEILLSAVHVTTHNEHTICYKTSECAQLSSKFCGNGYTWSCDLENFYDLIETNKYLASILIVFLDYCWIIELFISDKGPMRWTVEDPGCWTILCKSRISGNNLHDAVHFIPSISFKQFIYLISYWLLYLFL